MSPEQPHVYVLTALQVHPPTKGDLDTIVGVYGTEAQMLAEADRFEARAVREGRANGLQMVGQCYALGVESAVPTADGNYASRPLKTYRRDGYARWLVSCPPADTGSPWTTEVLRAG